MPIDFNRSFAVPPVAGAAASAPAMSAGHAAENGTDRSTALATPRNTQPRAIANSALQALKALGPRLTPAQRTSIGILENYETWRTQARTNADMFDAQVLPDMDRETDCTLSRRPSFLLLKPVLTDLGSVVATTADDMSLPRTLGDRTTLTAQVAAAHETAQVLKARAVNDAQAGDRLCPLTLQKENFARFLEDNRYTLQRIVGHCADMSRIEALEVDLEELAFNYLADCGIPPTGLDPDDIPEQYREHFDGEPVNVSIVRGFLEPQHAILGDEDGCACLIRIPIDGIETVSRNPAYPFRSFPGLSSEFVHCEEHERAASMILQHLFSELAAVEQESAVHEAAEDGEFDDNDAAIRTGTENSYCGSEILGDQCGNGEVSTERSRSLVELRRVRHMVTMHDESNDEPLLTVPALKEWVKGVEFGNDMQIIAQPIGRLERAQLGAVSAALRATGVFPSFPAER